MKVRTSLIGGAAALALAVGACGSDDGGDSTGTQASGGGGGGEVTTISFMQPLPKSIAFYPLWVGEELGYFEEEGVAIELLPAGDVNPLTVISTGQGDVGSTNAGELIVGSTEDLGYKVFYEYYQKNVFSIVVPADSDVQDLSDLEGRKLGITSESGGDAPVARTALQKAGLDPDSDVEIIAVGDGGPQVVRALEDGRIDAYTGAIQDLVALNVIGVELRDITPPDIADIPASSFFAMPELLEQLGPEKTGGFLRAWAKATYAGIKNPDQVLAMAETQVPEEASDPAFAQALLDVSIQLQTPVGGMDQFGVIRPEQWELEEAQQIDSGELDGPADLETLLDDQYIEAANDFDRAEVEQEMADWGG